MLIPASNVKHLMLRPDVVGSVAAGQFQVYAVETIDQGIELLTGIPAGERDNAGAFPAGSVNQRVEARLVELAEKRLAFGVSERGVRGMNERELEPTIRRILVALNASPHSQAALEAASELADVLRRSWSASSWRMSICCVWPVYLSPAKWDIRQEPISLWIVPAWSGRYASRRNRHDRRWPVSPCGARSGGHFVWYAARLPPNC